MVLAKKTTYFILLSLAIAGIHHFLGKLVLKPGLILVYVYSFLVPVSSFFFFFCMWIYYKRPQYVGYAYMLSGLAKMAFSIFFLYFVIRNLKYPRKYFLIQYMIAYFGILFAEVLLLVKELTNEEGL